MPRPTPCMKTSGCGLLAAALMPGRDEAESQGLRIVVAALPSTSTS